MYCAPWEWVVDPVEGLSFWRAPGGDALATLDLRTLPQMASAGALIGLGIFAYSSPHVIADSIDLGSDLDRAISPPSARALAERLILPSRPSGALRDVLWQLLTVYSDPLGQTGPKPLMPTSRGVLRLHFNGIVREEGFDLSSHSHGPKVLSLIHNDYRRQRESDLVRGSVTYRRVLDALSQKYRVLASTFIPPDLPPEEPLPRSTTITDNFNRANADAMGTSSEGWSWTEVLNDWDIVTNRVRAAVNAGGGNRSLARAETDLSSDDHYSQNDFVSGNSNFAWSAPAVRFAAAASTCYEGFGRIQGSLRHIAKVVAGAPTTLVSDANGTGPPHTFKLTVDGSALELFQDAVSILTVTDTAITGNLRTGITHHPDTGHWSDTDNFEAADLAAGGGATWPGWMGSRGGWS